MHTHALPRTLGAALLTLLAGTTHAQWRYESNVDKMTGKKTEFAQLRSSDSLDLPFPYKGQNHGELLVRRHPVHGLDVIFTIAKGQLVCRGVDSCGVVVKFDDKPPSQFAANRAADHDSKVLFIRDTKRFLASARTAKQILVQATYFQAGNQVLTFPAPTPLSWP